MECHGRLMRWFMATLIIPAILSSPLCAFAGGLTPEPLGAESFLSGVTPPGEAFVIKEYINFYTAKKLETNHGYGINHTVSLKTEGFALDKLQVIDFTTAKIGNKNLVGVRTNLTPGQDFHFDYAIAYALSKAVPHINLGLEPLDIFTSKPQTMRRLQEG